MSRLSKYVIWAVLIPALLSVVSCTDDRLFEEQDAPNGVDRDKMVEVTIPFSMGKGIQTNITTRSTADTDSQLSGIMVFVYENNGNPETDKRVAWQLFSNPAAGDLEHSSGGWIPDGDDPTCGKIKFHVPVGNCYIYLIGNASGTFLKFFPGIGTPGGNGEDPLATLQGFWDKGTPKWTENMDIVDGYLPLVGTVNNERGNCEVLANGSIKFKTKGGNEHTISPNSTDESDDNSFVLKRLMSKVTVNIKSPEGVTFTPKDYRFRHVATYVSPIDAAWTDDQKNRIPVTDTEVVPFSAQTPNSFTVYLPENVRTATNEIKDFAEREAIVKENGKNTLETEEGHDEHYQFQNAPKNSTYMEITGRFEGQNENGTTLSADCRYFIHLGDFGPDKGYKDFSLRRDHHYTYNINVKGVDKIEVEVEGDGTEAPGAEGIVFEGGARVQLDAHYEQVEMHLKKNDIKDGVYIYAQTPFGMVNCKYLPAIQELDKTHTNTPESLEQIKKLLQWVEFKKQEDGMGTLATYQTGTTKNVFETLNEVYESTDGAYYTCFVDEYYYTSDPLNDKRSIHLSDFVNVEDRTFSLGSQLQYSADGKSAVSRAVYVLQQRSIATFYDLDNHEVAKYGVETIDEIGELVGPMKYTTDNAKPKSESTDPKNGRDNTIKEIGIENDAVNNYAVNWAQNGFLLSKDEKTLEAGEQRLNTNTQAAYLACLTRNRDFDGNGKIGEDELRWYTPARDQVLGLWIGEPALPVKAALYPNSTTGLKTDPNTCQWPVFTSTGGENRVIWAEQGASFGSEGSAGDGGYVRVVRNLGDRPSQDSYKTNAEPYYEYDGSNRTIEVYLTSNALRAFSSRELAPHHERSVINRPYKKFQVANHPYVKENVQVTCSQGSGGTKYYTQLQATNENKAKTDVTTIASQYTGDEPNISNATWRLPNQREIALMIVAMGTDLGYTKVVDGDAEYYNRWDCSCRHIFVHNWQYSKTSILHCRTSFSKEGYSKGYLGYMYNTEGKKMQMMHNTGGAGATGIAGYLCVRDVPN